MKLTLRFAFIFLLIPSAIYCQKVSIVSGDLNFLKNISKLNIEYDYEGMAVGKFKDGDAYIEKKVKEYNKKDPGSGDLWEDNWRKDRITSYEPNFEKNFNRTFKSKDINIIAESGIDAEYTMILKTTFTEPGFNVGIQSKSSVIDATVYFVETQNPDNIIAELTIKKALGNTNYDAEERISAAYAVAGWKLARTIWKLLYK